MALFAVFFYGTAAYIRRYNQKHEVAEMELVEIKQELNIMAKRLADFRGSL